MKTILPIYILLHAGNGVLLKALALNGVSTGDTLIFRGLGCVLVALAVGLHTKCRLWPEQPSLQAFRFAVSGLALWALTAAYQHANATTVNIIMRLDTALLVIGGPAIGVAVNNLQRALAVLCVVLLLGVPLSGGLGPGESLLGYGLAVGGTIGITVGYLFLRASAKKEPMPVVAWVAGAAILFYGLVTRGTGPLPQPMWMGLGLLSGAIMYSLYDLTVRLYKVMDVARAEYPTLFAALLVMALEAALLGIHFPAWYVACMVANVVLLGIVLGLRPK